MRLDPRRSNFLSLYLCNHELLFSVLNLSCVRSPVRPADVPWSERLRSRFRDIVDIAHPSRWRNDGHILPPPPVRRRSKFFPTKQYLWNRKTVLRIALLCSEVCTSTIRVLSEIVVYFHLRFISASQSAASLLLIVAFWANKLGFAVVCFQNQCKVMILFLMSLISDI